MSLLLPFDPTSRCVKCGSTNNTNMTFHGAADDSCPDTHPEEHIHNTCHACQAKWMTQPVDAAS